jgi:hypothetical protein
MECDALAATEKSRPIKNILVGQRKNAQKIL